MNWTTIQVPFTRVDSAHAEQFGFHVLRIKYHGITYNRQKIRMNTHSQHCTSPLMIRFHFFFPFFILIFPFIFRFLSFCGFNSFIILLHNVDSDFVVWSTANGVWPIKQIQRKTKAHLIWWNKPLLLSLPLSAKRSNERMDNIHLEEYHVNYCYR